MDSSATLHLSTRQLGHLPASQPPDAAIPLLSGWAPMPLGSLPPADSSLTQDEAAAVDRALRTPWDRTLIMEAHPRGLTMRHPAVPDSVKWEYGLPYNKPKTNIKLNQIPPEQEIEENFN